MISEHRLSLATLSLLLAFAPAARSEVVFDFDYSDPSAATYWTPEARAALAAAGQKVAAYLVNYTATVTIGVSGYQDNLDATAAYAGTNFVAGKLTPGYDNIGAVGAKILSNGAYDLNDGDLDGYIVANMTDRYSFGDVVDPGKYDFTSILMHEIGHTLGFVSYTFEDGGTYVPNVFAPIDQYLVTKGGQSVIDADPGAGLYAVNTSLWTAAFAGGTDGGLYFNGPNAMAANGGNPVLLESEPPFYSGYSISHVPYTGDGSLMAGTFYKGQYPQAFSPIEIGIFRDLGYTTFVPEPGSSLLAMGGLMAGLRRRRPDRR